MNGEKKRRKILRKELNGVRKLHLSKQINEVYLE